MNEPEMVITVIGVGNVLFSDEGVGVRAVECLSEEEMPSSVRLVDGGTAGIDLIYSLEEADFAIIIDCLQADTEPGTIFRIPAEELILTAADSIVSLHDVSLREVLSLCRNLGKLPPTVIYGIQPETTDLGMELSAKVRDVLPRLVNLIKSEIRTCQKK